MSTILDLLSSKYTVFVGSDTGSLLLFLYIIAQIIAYSYSKKFFHDQISNTVIGERSA